jgi:hypothetical protein
MEYRANLSSAERELERVRAGIRKVIDAVRGSKCEEVAGNWRPLAAS